MDLRLKNKTVVVLAASSGIGRGVATELTREGATVILFGRSEERLKKAQKEIANDAGNEPDYFLVDLTDARQIEQGIQKTIEKYGAIYALFNNTGGPKAGTFENFSDQDWVQAFELTLLSYVRTIRAVLPAMKANQGGRIVNNASSSVKQVIDHLILSNTFRMGIAGLSKSLARELAPYSILVNVVGAGKIATDRVRQLDRLKAEQEGITLEKFQQKNAARIPVGRYGSIDEIGRLVAFLCSPANTYVTGQTILVDGAMSTAY